MKSSYALKSILLIFAAAAFGACSSAQQDEEELENQEYDQGDLDIDDAGEGNGQENFVDGDNYSQYQESQGADVNSETFNDTSEDFDPTLNSGGNSNFMGMENTAMESTDTGMMNTATMNAAMSPPMNTTTAAPMNSTYANAAPAAAAPSGSAPVPGGRVRYVREGGVQVVNAPGGAPVLTLEQGDHPVTWEENGWYRITTGHYVPIDSLSDKGVPRAPSGFSWQ